MTNQSENISAASAKVFVRESWSWNMEEWTEITDAKNIRCTKSLSSTIPSASFETFFGQKWEVGDTEILQKGTDPNDYLDWWVRVESDFDGDGVVGFKWFGVITDVVSKFLGATPDVSDPTGIVQTIDYDVSCLGLEYLLTRKQITQSVVDEDNSTSTSVTVNRAIGFNRWTSNFIGKKIVAGNFNLGPSPEKYWFANIDIPWSSYEIVEYLLRQFPVTTTPAWEIDLSSQNMNDSLGFNKPVIDTNGRTVYEILNDAFSRRRGLAWHIEVDEPKKKIMVVPKTQLDQDLSLPSGGIIYANPTQTTVDLLQEQSTISFERVKTRKKRYQQVKVRGERKGIVGTFRGGSELIAKFSAFDETSYADGRNNVAGYGSMTVGEKARINDSERMKETLADVYTTFVVSPTWDGLLDGEVAISPSETWVRTLRFENVLPLLKGLDYSADPANPTGTREEEYVRPVVVIDDGTGKFEYVDRLSSLAFTELFGDGITFSCTTRVLNNRMGIKVIPSTVPHAIGLNHFDPLTAEPSGYSPLLDWEDIQATLYFKTDEYCEGVYPDDPEDEVHDQQSVLVIDIGDRARLDEVLDKTIVALDEGGLVKAAQSGFINDDRELCKDLAKAAFAIHGEEHNAIRYTRGILSDRIRVGDLITKFTEGNDEVVVNTIVSQVSWDFDRGTTQIQTELLELDIRSLV